MRQIVTETERSVKECLGISQTLQLNLQNDGQAHIWKRNSERYCKTWNCRTVKKLKNKIRKPGKILSHIAFFDWENHGEHAKIIRHGKFYRPTTIAYPSMPSAVAAGYRNTRLHSNTAAMIQKLYRELSALREQFDAYWKEAGHIGFNSENPITNLSAISLPGLTKG